jgi:hypothetical protein
VTPTRRGGDGDDGQEPVIVEELGEVLAAKRAVVDDAERARE